VVKFCVNPGCFEVAVGAARSRDHCREHYLSEVLKDAELVRCEVIGSHRITDARTGNGVAKGGVVEIDPTETHVVQLVAAGHVRVIAAKPSVKKG
jgi:hypothetical protein